MHRANWDTMYFVNVSMIIMCSCGPHVSRHLTISCTSPSHHLTISPSHHLTISPSHHLTISPSHHLTISPSHHLTISPSHHLTISCTSPSHRVPGICESRTSILRNISHKITIKGRALGLCKKQKTNTWCSRKHSFRRSCVTYANAGVTARIYARRNFPAGKLQLVEVFLGKVLLALVFRPSGTFPGPTVEIICRWIFSGLGIFLRNSAYSYATNQVVAYHIY